MPTPVLRVNNSVRRSPRVTQAEQAALGLLLAVFFVLFITQGFRVSGDCMRPHIATGERVLAYKLAYAVNSPRRGDIVIFQYPRDPRQTFVKRIVGLPGDTVSIAAGRVFVDGRLLPEPYRVYAAHGDMAPQFVPHESYFVMGDNRDVSDDSRYWGDLPRHDIIGRAVACYWPPQHCHLLR